MDWSAFQSKYPDLGSILPANFMQEADIGHTTRDNIANDNDRYLNHLNELVRMAPTTQILKGSYENQLHDKMQFSGFKSELIASVLIDEYVCSSDVADIKETAGNPDFTCKSCDLDFEVFRIGQGDVLYRLRRAAEEIFDPIGGCHVMISGKPGYRKMAQTGESIRKNEQAATEIIDQMRNVDLGIVESSFVVESDVISVEVQIEDSWQNVGVMMSEGMTANTMIDYEDIRQKIRGKTKKQRGDTPLVLFIDTDIDMLIDEELIKSVRGNQIEGMTNLFSEKLFDYVAGIVFVDIKDECVVLTNETTGTIDGPTIYQNNLSKLDGQNAFQTIKSLYQ